MDVTGSDEMVALVLLATLLMVVVIDEGVAEGLAVPVVEGVSVALVLTTT